MSFGSNQSGSVQNKSLDDGEGDEAKVETRGREGIAKTTVERFR
jgi:hypothetical protein